MTLPLHTWCCTTAIITARASATGHPLLWKQRDTGSEWNGIRHFQGPTHAFTGLVDSTDTQNIWIGANDAGFAIMNNASYNLKPDSLKGLPENEGIVMMQALGSCTTVADFEQMIRRMPTPRCVEANFGVIDGHGGAAYFEVWDYGYTLYDANDPTTAPDGYLIRTNFSFSGRPDRGYGYERYYTEQELFTEGYRHHELSPEWILSTPSRSFRNTLLGTDLRGKEHPHTAYAVDQDYIPRRITSASVVVEGVLPNESADATTLWCILGYPPCSYALSAWVAAGDRIATPLKADTSGRAPLHRLATDRKARIFEPRHGEQSPYIRFDRITQDLIFFEPYERRSVKDARRTLQLIRKEGFDLEKVERYNLLASELFDQCVAALHQEQQE